MGRFFLSILCSVIFAINHWSAERLLYAIRYESLQCYPDIVYAKIYSLDLRKKENYLVFSD